MLRTLRTIIVMAAKVIHRPQQTNPLHQVNGRISSGQYQHILQQGIIFFKHHLHTNTLTWLNPSLLFFIAYRTKNQRSFNSLIAQQEITLLVAPNTFLSIFKKYICKRYRTFIGSTQYLPHYHSFLCHRPRNCNKQYSNQQTKFPNKPFFQCSFYYMCNRFIPNLQPFFCLFIGWHSSIVFRKKCTSICI